MEEIKKMLRVLLEHTDNHEKMIRAIVNGQTAMKQELLGEIKNVRTDLADHRKETKEGFEAVNKRIDKLGSDLAFLEDDSPTREEHDNLDNRVKNLEDKTASL